MLNIKLSQKDQEGMKAFAEQMKFKDPKVIRNQMLEIIQTGSDLKKIVAQKIEAWFQLKYGDLETMSYGETWRIE